MVLVSNEWPNKSEDEQKSTASSNANATTATSATATATTTTNTNTTATATTATTKNASNNLNKTAIEATTSNSIEKTTTTNSFDSDVITTSSSSPSPSSITIASKNLKTSETKTKSSNANNDQKTLDQDDNISSSSTISDLEDPATSPISANGPDNNNGRSSNSKANAASSVATDDHLPTVLNVIETLPKDLESNDGADTISNTNTLDNDDQQPEHDDEDDVEQTLDTTNSRISSIDLSTALNSAFKSMNVVDKLSNKRSAPSTSATTTAAGVGPALPSLSSAPATASNTLSNSYLATFGMGLSAHNVQHSQQQQIKSGFTTITTNLHDTPVNIINNNNNNHNNNITLNNNINNNINNNNTIAATLNSSTYSTAPTAATTALTNVVIEDNNQAKIILLCESNSHPFQTRTIPLTPNIECKVGRLIARSKANETNAIFDCKVLSRNHAVLWFSDDNKFWVKDTKSSNGTFINDNKLGNDAAELHFGDVVKFGVDVWENSRKEAHGCIIASVKLYLPDGREAISIDPDTQRTQYSGEGRISYDEMHRLNMFLQDAATREKGLKTKLCGIQNVLDTTRKSSALCWEAMVNEDVLLHRIASLEKKLQIMDKNMPENVLRNEVLKLLDDKNAYQTAAKEALRKVYQERCDALQMLAKVEADYATAENECALLREEISTTKQTMHEINARLLQLETEYNDFKDEVHRHQLEAKAKEEDHVHTLHEQLQQREVECDNLRKQIIQLQKITSTRPAANPAKMLGNVKNLKKKNAADASNNSNKDDDTVGTDTEDEEKEVIEKLDAAIGGFMNLEDDDNEGEDDDLEDEDEDGDGDDVVNDDDDCNRSNKEDKLNDSNDKIKSDELYVLNELEKALQDSETFNGDENNKMCSLKRKKKCSNRMEKDLKQKVVKKSTVMKWLKNSDLNNKEGSIDIFKAMFNNDDDSNEEEHGGENKDEVAGAGANKKQKLQDNTADDHANLSLKEYEIKCSNFKSKLQNVQNNLEQLETEIANETNTLSIIQKLNLDSQQQLDNVQQLNAGAIGSNIAPNNSDDDEEDDDDDLEEEHFKDEDADSEFIIKRNGATATGGSAKRTACSKQNKSYLLLKQSVDMLREAFNEISNVKPQMQKAMTLTPTRGGRGSSGKYTHTHTHARTQHHKQSKLHVPDTLQPLKEAPNESDSDESDDDNESAEILDVNDEEGTQQNALEQYEHEIKLLQTQIDEMRNAMEQKENDAQHTLEIMEIECENYKLKFNNLTTLIDTLNAEKEELETVIKENKSNLLHSNGGAIAANKTATTSTTTNILEIIDTETTADSRPVHPDTVAAEETQTKTKCGAAAKLHTDTETNQSLDYSKSYANFENELHEEHAAALALEREEELIAFKERLEQQQQINHKLLVEIDKLNQIAVCNTQKAIKQYILPLGAIALAALVYFVTQNIF